MDDLMDKTSYGKAARQKFGAVPDGFHVFAAEWIGDGPTTWTAMRVKGAQFTGRRRVPGTTMETIVTKQEMSAHHKPPNDQANRLAPQQE
jgi:hypothetical protein